MSSIWTPQGEVSPEPESSGESQLGTKDELEDAFAGMSEEEKQAALDQIRAMRTELLATPAADIIGNHIVGFYELASVHLSEAANATGAEKDKRLAETSLCIDAMGSTLDGLGDRLGNHVEPLQAALAQMRLAFAQVKSGQMSEPQE